MLVAEPCFAALRDSFGFPLSHPGISLHPNSPSPSLSCRLSSEKPTPIHSCPLNPLAANGGPNAAGRAGKKVLLSSVRLMEALGGNREKGVVKEKKGRSVDFCGGGDDDAAGPWRRIELMDRHTRKKDAEKKRTRMAIRGGRIVDEILSRAA